MIAGTVLSLVPVSPKVIHKKTEKLYTVVYCCTVICFGISISQQFEENAVVSCLLPYISSMTAPDITQDLQLEMLSHSPH